MFLYAFDLIELGGEDRRRDALAHRKVDLSRLLADAGPGVLANEWVDGGERDGPTVFEHACSLGLEGIVSKRKDFALYLGAIAVLAQDGEPGERGGAAGGGGRSGRR